MTWRCHETVGRCCCCGDNVGFSGNLPLLSLLPTQMPTQPPTQPPSPASSRRAFITKTELRSQRGKGASLDALDPTSATFGAPVDMP